MSSKYIKVLKKGFDFKKTKNITEINALSTLVVSALFIHQRASVTE